MENKFNIMADYINSNKQLIDKLKTILSDIEDQAIKNNGEMLLSKMDSWDKKMMQRKSLAYDDVENFPNKFLADYLFILDEIKGDIPNISEGILKSLESLDKKWDSLKEEIDNINENDIPNFNNELWKSGIGALN
jgi:hypothetical protein